MFLTQVSHIDFAYVPCCENKTRSKVHRHLFKREVWDNNIFIVADDDQVIYGWNGADYKRSAEFKDEYKADLIQLNQNFRCSREVIQAANNIIAEIMLSTYIQEFSMVSKEDEPEKGSV